MQMISDGSIMAFNWALFGVYIISAWKTSYKSLSTILPDNFHPNITTPQLSRRSIVSIIFPSIDVEIEAGTETIVTHRKTINRIKVNIPFTM